MPLVLRMTAFEKYVFAFGIYWMADFKMFFRKQVRFWYLYIKHFLAKYKTNYCNRILRYIGIEKVLCLHPNWYAPTVYLKPTPILGKRALTCKTSFWFTQAFLTLKWSRGVPRDPKISFRALARKREVFFYHPSMTLSNFTLRFFWGQKKSHRPWRHCAN